MQVARRRIGTGRIDVVQHAGAAAGAVGTAPEFNAVGAVIRGEVQVIVIDRQITRIRTDTARRVNVLHLREEACSHLGGGVDDTVAGCLTRCYKRRIPGEGAYADRINGIVNRIDHL